MAEHAAVPAADTEAAADLNGIRATVMGLGLHGGGLAAAQFLVRHGARVTVTDLRPRSALQASLEQLDASVRLVLGRHETADFAHADLVLKNPAVPADSPLLQAARRAGIPIETDISLFRRLHPAIPLLAVTGSKGKSTTAAALHHGLQRWYPDARLGGNITTSPLTFAAAVTAHTPVVLELSSWQLGDLPNAALLRPRVAVLTNILPDHQDRYPSLRAYARDKLRLFAGQSAADCAILGVGTTRWIEQPPAARQWHVAEAKLDPGQCGAVLAGDRAWLQMSAHHREPLVAARQLPGRHNLLNLAAAALGVAAFVGPGEAARIARTLAGFTGLEHRLEAVARWRGVHFVNDSAATMPHATAAALGAVPRPVTLIAGGNDKQLDFSVLAAALEPVTAVVLLAGTATAKLAAAVAASRVSAHGPFTRLDAAVRAAVAATPAGGTVLFSPAATSFGMFAHEFERGRAFKRVVAELIGGDDGADRPGVPTAGVQRA
jgi:UDP-N-acetylmuramoylalanine--D-glutamate ligase